MPKQTVRHDPGMYDQSVEDTELAVANADLGVYAWAGGLYRIHTTNEATKLNHVARDKGSVILVPVTSTHMVELATVAAVHVKYDARSRGDRVLNCPRSVAEGILARGHHPKFPVLNGIVEAATLDETGRLIDAKGFDPKTGLYLATNGQIPAPRARGRSAGGWGITRLLDHIKTFPFKTDADRTAALASIMTALLRRILPSAPMFGISAPAPGSGKTLWAEMVSMIATGRRPPVISIGGDENEFSKRVYGVLLAGDLILLLDNVTRPIGTEDVLNQLLTSPVLRFRPLGSSGMVSAPTNLLVLVTGNNLAVISDAKRRTILIKIDANQERPEQREFQGDILKETLTARNELISAALWISKSYLDAGAPAVDAKPYGSFNTWDKMVRRALIWHGQADPLSASESLRESDPDIECTNALFSAWYKTFGEDEATSSDVVSRGLDQDCGRYTNRELHDALQIACRERINGHQLGIWLRKHQDRIVEGLQLVKAGTDGHAKISRWKVVKP